LKDYSTCIFRAKPLKKKYFFLAPNILKHSSALNFKIKQSRRLLDLEVEGNAVLRNVQKY
jgi:hypothetical protein